MRARSSSCAVVPSLMLAWLCLASCSAFEAATDPTTGADAAAGATTKPPTDAATSVDGAPTPPPSCGAPTMFGGDLSALPAGFTSEQTAPTFDGRMVASLNLPAGSKGQSYIERAFQGPISFVSMKWSAELAPAADTYAEVGCHLDLFLDAANDTPLLQLTFKKERNDSVAFDVRRTDTPNGGDTELDTRVLAEELGAGAYPMELVAETSGATLAITVAFGGNAHVLQPIPLGGAIQRARVRCGLYFAENHTNTATSYTVMLDDLAGTVCAGK